MIQSYGRLSVYWTSGGTDVIRFVRGAITIDISAPTGGTSTELAGGLTLSLSESASLCGETGKLWSSGGDTKVKNDISGSVDLEKIPVYVSITYSGCRKTA